MTASRRIAEGAAVYGRTPGRDQWLRCVPEGLTAAEVAWLRDQIAMACSDAEDLRRARRWFLARDGRLAVAGVAAVARDLDDRFGIVGTRQLYGAAAIVIVAEEGEAPALAACIDAERDALASTCAEHFGREMAIDWDRDASDLAGPRVVAGRLREVPEPDEGPPAHVRDSLGMRVGEVAILPASALDDAWARTTTSTGPLRACFGFATVASGIDSGADLCTVLEVDQPVWRLRPSARDPLPPPRPAAAPRTREPPPPKTVRPQPPPHGILGALRGLAAETRDAFAEGLRTGDRDVDARDRSRPARSGRRRPGESSAAGPPPREQPPVEQRPHARSLGSFEVSDDPDPPETAEADPLGPTEAPEEAGRPARDPDRPDDEQEETSHGAA